MAKGQFLSFSLFLVEFKKTNSNLAVLLSFIVQRAMRVQRQYSIPRRHIPLLNVCPWIPTDAGASTVRCVKATFLIYFFIKRNLQFVTIWLFL